MRTVEQDIQLHQFHEQLAEMKLLLTRGTVRFWRFFRRPLTSLERTLLTGLIDITQQCIDHMEAK